MSNSVLNKPERLFEVDFEVFMPIATSGYDTNTRHTVDKLTWYESIRAPSIRGVWRWWLRTLFAGVAWDRGKNEVESALKATEVLGYVGKKKSSRSYLMMILTRPSSPPEHASRIKIGKVPRVSLLRRDVHFHPQDASCKLKVYSLVPVKPKGLRDVALASLVLSASLGGFGKIARRGFGKLKPLKIEKSPETLRRIMNLWQELFNEDEERVKEALKELCESIYELADKTFNEFEAALSSQGNLSQLPRIPAFSKRKIKIEEIEIPYCQVLLTSTRSLSKRLESVIEKDSSLKIDRGINYYRMGGFLDRNKPLHLIGMLCRILAIKLGPDRWILGGPRKWRDQNDRTKQREIKRRASPVWFTILGEHGSYHVVATVFLSKDWPHGYQVSRETLSPFGNLLDLLFEYNFRVVWPNG